MGKDGPFGPYGSGRPKGWAQRGSIMQFERVNVYSWTGGEFTEVRAYDYEPSALEEFRS